LSNDICGLIIKSKKENSDDNTWNTINHNDVNRHHVSRRRVNILVLSYLLEICLNQETVTILISYLPYQISLLKVDLGEDGEE
ncbi:13506_t:CDS:1, partial [Acaulospora colombiana]